MSSIFDHEADTWDEASMEVVYKFGPLGFAHDERNLAVAVRYRLSKPLSVGAQYGNVFLWGISNLDTDKDWELVIIGTGWDVPERFIISEHFVGSVQIGSSVWHALARPFSEN